MKTFRKFQVEKKNVKNDVKVLKINAKTNEVNVGQMCLTITLITIFPLRGSGWGPPGPAPDPRRLGVTGPRPSRGRCLDGQLSRTCRAGWGSPDPAPHAVGVSAASSGRV